MILGGVSDVTVRRNDTMIRIKTIIKSVAYIGDAFFILNKH